MIEMPTRDQFPADEAGLAGYQKSLLEFSVAMTASGDNQRACEALVTLNPVRYQGLSPKGDAAPATRLLRAIDLNSAWGTDLHQLIQTYQVEHVILHTYTQFENPRLPAVMIRQAEAVREEGCTVGNYGWAFGGYSPEATVTDMLSLAHRAGQPGMPVAWADCETYNDGNYRDNGPTKPDWLRRYRRECEQLKVRPGWYTGLWWVDGYFEGGRDAWQEFADDPQWLADYDDVENIDVFTPYSGVTQLAAKQWWAHPVDLDLIRSEYTVAA